MQIHETVKSRSSGDWDFSEYIDLMRSHHADAKKMAAVLGRIPIFEKRADRMSHCSTIATGKFCPHCKTFHTVRASLCRDRLCPNCGWVLARRRAYAISQAFDGLQNVFHPVVLHLVLTVRHDSKTALSAMLNQLISGFQRLVRTKALSTDRIGYIRSVEVKHNRNGFHPHIHLLLVMDESYYSHMIKQKDLVKMWRNACGLDYDPVVWIKSAYDKKGSNDLKQAIYECVKYCVKTSEWSKMSKDVLYEAATAIHSRTLFYVGGKLLRREYADAMKRLTDITEDDADLSLCNKCGSKRYDLTLNAEVIGKNGNVDKQ